MDTAAIIAELEAERDRLDSAIAVLRGSRNKDRNSNQQARWPEAVTVGGSQAEDRSSHEEALGRAQEERSGLNPAASERGFLTRARLHPSYSQSITDC
jgi:hypothetical protein